MRSLSEKATGCENIWLVSPYPAGRVDIEIFAESCHAFVFAGHPFWESHCFDRDVPAIAAAYNAPFLVGVIAFNEQMKAQEVDQDV